MKISPEEDKMMSQIANLESELTRKRKQLLDIRIAKTGISIGDEVSHRGKPHIVRDIHPRSYDPKNPWLIVSPQKKDGSWSMARKRIFDDEYERSVSATTTRAHGGSEC